LSVQLSYQALRRSTLILVEHAVTARPVADVDLWARAALDRLSRVAGVHRVGLALTEGGGRRLLFAASDRDNDPGLDWCHVDAYHDVPLNAVVRSGSAVTGSLDDLRHRYPEFVDRQSATATSAIAGIPIRAAGQVVGGFILFYGPAQSFDAAQCRELDELGASLGADLRRVQRSATRSTTSLVDEPVPRGASAATHVVVADPRAVAPARAFLRATLSDWAVDDDCVETAVLCLSELITNAIIHTSGGCEVRVVLDHGVLTTTVRDSGPTLLPSASVADPLAVHGRGLELVDMLAARWASDLDAVGTTVWFVLEPAAG
jgi:anti-sigma regulatory factor (Ser/Thr protein kinase)